ncbi:SRPBCC family protein [Halococcus dombrowskii]|uniref:SRPBCC family protein n=1 Tax=Halococcus dombrowskii TaxID=179637 RepID=A0AAV3SC92_HALDO|nr:SRPBCC family protein [Halococcus dombrowskii]UOO94463.1 SRPBCC family protein [Halococcus dombrowskii]
MTVRVERTFELAVPPEQVWAFIADPGKRAEAISVVDSFEIHDETHATWHIALPIPFVDRTIAVETEDTERDPPTHVEFVGRSRVLRVVGEHDLETVDDGTRLRNRFTVEGKMPGVEGFFKRNLDDELDNLEAAIRADTAAEP